MLLKFLSGRYDGNNYDAIDLAENKIERPFSGLHSKKEKSTNDDPQQLNGKKPILCLEKNKITYNRGDTKDKLLKQLGNPSGKLTLFD